VVRTVVETLGPRGMKMAPGAALRGSAVRVG
jgi:hypothetical protein